MKSFLGKSALSTAIFAICFSQSHQLGNQLFEPSMAQMDHDMMMHEQHHSYQTGNTIAKLRVRSKIVPKKDIDLEIDIQDKNGKAITSFDIFQEKKMHLILVSDDLQYFQHLHPIYQNKGSFRIKTNFPQPGNYTFFSSYKPSGKSEQVSVMKIKVPGTPQVLANIDLTTSKIFGHTKTKLTFSPSTFTAGQEVMVMFDLKDMTNNQPITDLQPYLGERGHLVIVKQSSILSASNYIHAHAMKNTPNGQIHYMTKFPQPGKYKLWNQFKRNGKVITSDFWVNVQ